MSPKMLTFPILTFSLSWLFNQVTFQNRMPNLKLWRLHHNAVHPTARLPRLQLPRPPNEDICQSLKRTNTSSTRPLHHPRPPKQKGGGRRVEESIQSRRSSISWDTGSLRLTLAVGVSATADQTLAFSVGQLVHQDANTIELKVWFPSWIYTATDFAPTASSIRKHQLWLNKL